MTNRPVEHAHLSQEERGQTQSAARGALGKSRIKHKLAGAGRSTGHAEVLRVAEIHSPFIKVITQGFGPIVHPLELLLGLQHRTVTVINLQIETEAHIISAKTVNNERWHPRGENISW